jgi:hypothetical protein
MFSDVQHSLGATVCRVAERSGAGRQGCLTEGGQEGRTSTDAQSAGRAARRNAGGASDAGSAMLGQLKLEAGVLVSGGGRER